MLKLLTSSLLFVGLGAVAWADDSSVTTDSTALELRAECSSDGHKTLVPAFELVLSATSAKIEVVDRKDEDSFVGSLKASPRGGSGKLYFTGFAKLLPEFDTTLVVPATALQETEFSVRLYGRGAALFTEDYDCKKKN